MNVPKINPILIFGSFILIASLAWSDEQKAELVLLHGHTGSVNTVAISPDGKTIVSGSRDKTVKLWNSGTCSLIRTLDGAPSTIHAVAISPEGTCFRKFRLYHTALGFNNR